jgi:hypothetical protein
MGRGESISALRGWVERWGLISPRSDESVGGMMRDGVKALEDSAALGDSLIGACDMESVESCESSSLRRDPARRRAPWRAGAPSPESTGLKS